jgi:hypothetical protein
MIDPAFPLGEELSGLLGKVGLLAGLLLAILPDLRTRALIEELNSGRSVDDWALSRSIQAGQQSVIPARSPMTIGLSVMLGAVLFGAAEARANAVHQLRVRGLKVA